MQISFDFETEKKETLFLTIGAAFFVFGDSNCLIT